MKHTLIKLFILPSGTVLLLSLSVLSLVLIYFSPSNLSPQANRDREEFPDQRRGGGTHWYVNPDHVA